MRTSVPVKLEHARYIEFPFIKNTFNGAFLIHGPCGVPLRIIASDGAFAETLDEKGWEHVSVSTPKRIPNWQEMCFVKDLFWDEEEIVFQLHPAKSQWVNNHPNVLHLWRHKDKPVPLPPPVLVGVKSVGIIRDRAHAAEVRQRQADGEFDGGSEPTAADLKKMDQILTAH